MIALVAIGIELLEGSTVDTNTAFIGRALTERGLAVLRKETVSDAPREIRAAFERSLAEADVVIATGGLGPTLDDCTLEVAAELFGAALVHSDEVEADLRARFGNHISIPHQSRVPRGATFFCNGVGTAPAILLQKGKKQLILLPGVPAELRAFMTRDILPHLETLFADQTRFAYKKICLFQMTESQIDPFIRKLQEQFPDVQMGIYPSYGFLGVVLRGPEIETPYAEIARAYPDRIYEGSLEKTLRDLMVAKGETLALAESCTGGMIAGRLCQVPGASNYLLGGIVSYSNDIKEKILGVTSLDQGAVSEVVVREMALGAQKLCRSSYAIAVSGIAGPDGGTPDKPVGTVWCAIAGPNETLYTGLLAVKGGKPREIIIEYTGSYVIGSLWRLVQHGVDPFKKDI